VAGLALKLGFSRLISLCEVSAESTDEIAKDDIHQWKNLVLHWSEQERLSL
jgi:hypothetical protein